MRKTYINFESIDKNTLETQVIAPSVELNNLINKLVKPHIKELDNAVNSVKRALDDGNRDILAQYCVSLPILLYHVIDKKTEIISKKEISDAVFRERFNEEKKNVSGNTVAERDIEAEKKLIPENSIAMLYERAYKLLDDKIAMALELQKAIKKVLTVESEVSKK